MRQWSNHRIIGPLRRRVIDLIVSNEAGTLKRTSPAMAGESIGGPFQSDIAAI